MPNYLHQKKINSILIISLIFAIASRSFLEWMLFDLVSDKKVQIATALNYINGHGLSLAYVEANDLSNVIYEKVGLWPPGFALSIVPFIKSGFPPIRASIIAEVLAVVILFSSFFLIFKLLKRSIPPFLPIVFFIFYGLSLQPFNFLVSSGLQALSFCILAIYFLLRNLNYERSYYNVLGLGIFAFLPSFFHFSYYPISFFIPFLFLIYSLIIDKTKKKAAILSFLVCNFLIIGQLIYQASLPTGINYLTGYHPDTQAAPYWENLKMFLNLPFYLLSDGFILKRALTKINPSLYNVLFISGWITFIIVISMGFTEIIRRAKTLNLIRTKPDLQFVIISIILSVFLISFLIFLSLKYPPEDAGWMPNNQWTYVVEARYFALPIILLPLAIIISLKKLYKNKILKYSLKAIILLAFIISASINIYYIQKYGSGTPEENFARYYHLDNDFDAYLKQSLNSDEFKVVYAKGSENDDYAYYSILNAVPLLNYSELHKEFKTSQPVKVLLNVSDNLDPESQKKIKNLIEKYQLMEYKEFPVLQIRIYELHLP